MRASTLTTLILALIAWGATAPNTPAQDKSLEQVKASEKIKKELGERTVTILSEPTKLEVFRLSSAQQNPFPRKGQPVPKAAKSIGSDKLQWPITATGKEPSKEFVGKLRSFLFDEATDPENFDEKRFSFGPNADVAFRFWKEKESVTVVVHFDDWTYLVITRDAEGKETKISIGEFLAYNREKRAIEKSELFAHMKALAVEAFPDDQNLKAIEQPERLPFGPLVARKLPDELRTTLAGATRVETFRVKWWEPPRRRFGEAPPPVPDNLLGNDRQRWQITAAGKEHGKEFTAKLRDFLLDDATRKPSGMYVYSGNVAFRLWKNKESVTVIVDFSGSSFLLVGRDAEGKVTATSEGSFLYNAKGEFDNGDVFARIKALAVEAFPDDESLRGLTDNLGTLLDKAEPFELFSLDPRRAEIPKGAGPAPNAKVGSPQEEPAKLFHGYKILGKTTVNDAETRKKLVAAFKRGIEDNNGAAAACFNPRHGIRLNHNNKTMDFVICFECFFTSMYVGDKTERGFRTTGEPSAIFNEVLKEAKVPLPKN